jgi:hypothetical protein
VTLDNYTGTDLNRLLEIPYPLLDFITLYEVNEQNGITRRIETGDHFPFDQRPLDHRTCVFPIDLPDNSSKQIYIKVATSSSMQVSLDLWKSDAFHHKVNIENQKDMLYYGR